jgi:hypothetical protein
VPKRNDCGSNTYREEDKYSDGQVVDRHLLWVLGGNQVEINRLCSFYHKGDSALNLRRIPAPIANSACLAPLDILLPQVSNLAREVPARPRFPATAIATLAPIRIPSPPSISCDCNSDSGSDQDYPGYPAATVPEKGPYNNSSRDWSLRFESQHEREQEARIGSRRN